MSFAPAQRRPETSAPGDSSRTVTITDAPPREEETPSSPPAVGALKLRGGHRKVRQKVVWGEDVIDNEGCGKKKSKSKSYRTLSLIFFLTTGMCVDSLLHLPQA